MKEEAAFLFSELGQPDTWEQEGKVSYDVVALDAEYRDRLYSEKGRALLERLEQAHDGANPVRCATP